MKKILLILLVTFSFNANAGFFDIFTGHVDDIKSRFMDDQIFDGLVSREASFRTDDPGQDFIHNGSGDVSIKHGLQERFIQLESNFMTTPGPDYHVYVSAEPFVDDEASFFGSTHIEIGKLIKGSGASFYKIPAGTKVNSITIFCKEFGEFIASAEFQ